MEEVAYDTIISAFVLILLTVVITLARGNIDIIQKTAMRTNATDKVKQELLVPLKHGEVLGSDVISVVRYYSSDPAVSVKVSLAGGDFHTYIAEKYNGLNFKIPYEGRFDANYTYSPGGKVLNAEYTEK